MLRGRIGSSDNHRKSLQRAISKIVLFDYGVEATIGAVVSEFDIPHIERYRIFTFRYLHHLISRYVQKLGSWINKALDWPRTSDAIYFWSGSGYPFHIF